MNAKYAFISVLVFMAALVTTLIEAAGPRLVLFHPAGVIATQESALILRAIFIMALVVVPVFILTGVVVWRYRAGRPGARYFPNWEHNTVEEAVWWLVPLVIITVLAVLTWQSTHALNPYKPLSSAPPLEIEVVALDWKWLFMYPAQGVATVNELAIPTGVPIDFSLSADAPMNSFFIPALAGQMMAMPGMVTHLNAEADASGTFLGMSANYSGAGFAGMQFPVRAVSPEEFSAWVESVATSTPLDARAYAALAAPSEDIAPKVYRLADPALFARIVMSYMQPGVASSTPARVPSGDMSGMGMMEE